MKTDPLTWQKSKQLCNGIKDFGLLREPSHTNKSKSTSSSSIYFLRTVLTIGVIAAVAFLICIVLANKYHKSKTLSHHYASFVYKKEFENFPVHNYTHYVSLNDSKLKWNNLNKNDSNNYNSDRSTNTFNVYNFNKLRNISNKLSIEEINLLLPATTVLRSLNTSRNGRRLPSADLSFFNNANSSRIERKSSSGLADLLKRTERKLVPLEKNLTASHTAQISTSTVAETTMHFAQLESYSRNNNGNVKNFQDIMKYIRCDSAYHCDSNFEIMNQPNSATKNKKTAILTHTPVIADDDNIDYNSNENNNLDLLKNAYNQDIDNRQRTQAEKEEVSLKNLDSFTNAQHNTDDMMFSDTNIETSLHHSSSPSSSFFSTSSSLSLPYRIYNFRASSPLEINRLELEKMENTSKQPIVHRFSNRMYHNRDNLSRDKAASDIYSQTLEPFLKPPTPPPTTSLSFTPSYTTAAFHGLKQVNLHNIDSDLRTESTTILNTNTHMKPISLMIEIFPANDYELPGSLFDDSHFSIAKPSQQQTHGDDSTVSDNNPSATSWKQPHTPHNKMRLFVNLFPR